MKLDPKDVRLLAKKYLDGTATDQEKQLLHEWYDTVNPSDTEVVITGEQMTTTDFGTTALAELKQMIAMEQSGTPSPVKVRSIRWYRIAAAAAVIGAVGLVALFNLPHVPAKKAVVIAPAIEKEVPAPQQARAVITLADNKQVYLDSASQGHLAVQGSTNIVKVSDGHIAYIGGTQTSVPEYNVLTVPRGSRVVSIVLTDGTIVWLNAESSLRYPVVFPGNSRTVEISGEAYLEVQKDPSKKFYVKSGELTTEVLGTHFNVNTYKDEDAMKVTLLEGSIRVSGKSGVRPAIIRPGQQAQITDAATIRVVNDVDLEAVMAWKNEQFMMKGTDLASLTRQMARWYNVDILITGRVPDKKFGGSISRNVNLSTMLKALEENGIKSSIKERVVTIY